MKGPVTIPFSGILYSGRTILAILVLIGCWACKDKPTREEPVFPDLEKSTNISRTLRKLDSMEQYKTPHPEFYYYRGVLRFKNGDFKAAAGDLEKALKLANKPEYHYELAKVYLQLGAYRKSWFHSWVPEYEVIKKPLLFYVRARSLLFLGHPEKGIEEVNNLLEVAPGFSKGHYLKALLLHDAGDYEKSIRLAEEVLENQPDFQPALELMVTGYVQTGQKDRAMHYIKEGLKQDSANKYLYYRKGLLHQNNRQWGDALRAFREMHRIDSTDFRANFHLGKFAYQTKRYNDAIRYLSEAVKIRRDSLEPRRMLAGSYERTGKYSKALEEYKELVKRDSSNTYYQRKVRWLTRRTTRVINNRSGPAGNRRRTNQETRNKPDDTGQKKAEKENAGATENKNTNDSL